MNTEQSNSITQNTPQTNTRRKKQKISFALVCASNQNRSMAAHKVFKDNGIEASSYGTGSQVKLPGKTPTEPNVYEFGTPYAEILEDLKRKDEHFYTNVHALIPMLIRNDSVKRAPQRWQSQREGKHFDIVFCFEDRVFHSLVDDLLEGGVMSNKPTHVINLTVKDRLDEAEKGARDCLEFCKRLLQSDDWQNEITEIIENFEKETGKPLLHLCIFD